MAFLEWRRSTFFDAHHNADNGKLAEVLQDTEVTATTCGNSRVVICDSTGWAHLISKSWEITTFKAYELTITLAQQMQHEPYLVTVGDDEQGINPTLKVWDWSRTDRHGNPTRVRSSRVIPSHMQPIRATALAVHDNKNLLAVGFQDGSVTLYRGDFTRQRTVKMNTFNSTGTSPITALLFKSADCLFVVSRGGVWVQWAAGAAVPLEEGGAAPRAVTHDKQGNLMVGTIEAIYGYTPEGRGPCYAFKSEKVRIDWYRSYLAITTKEASKRDDASTSQGPPPKCHQVTILDIQNKFIVFSKIFDEIDAVLTEWGSFYILTKNKEVIYLEEKDLQSKLQMLFKKSLYDVAIKIVSSQHCDSDGLTEIYKQYGDHLYAKGDLRGAIEQYVKTIGWLETSYVIRKYLESRHLEPLIVYLEELHKKGYATEDHTTLLLTCYVKIDQHDQQQKLKKFINSKDKAIEFDVDVAIKVVREVSPEDALTLAENYKRHDWYLKIMLEDKKEYKTAVKYIADLQFDDAEEFMKKYGHVLIQHAPKESTDLLKLLCTDYRPFSAPLVDDQTMQGGVAMPDRALPDDFIHLYLNNSEELVELLEHMIKSGVECSSLVYNALIEHYLHVWSKSTESDKQTYEDKVMKVLKKPEATYDRDQTLIICQLLGFEPGLLYLYEKNKFWRLLVSRHVSVGRWSSALSLGGARRDLLHRAPPRDVLPTLLSSIANEKLISPILVIDCLADTPSYTLGDVRKYLMDVLKSESEVITREQELAKKYKSETDKMKSQIQSLQQSPVTFQSSRCAACSRPLELPSVHFFCQHSFHQYCFAGYAEVEGECPCCASARAPPRPPPGDLLHDRLRRGHDAYAVISEYFGRGLFNKIALVSEESPVTSPSAVTSSGAVTSPPAFGPGAEARMRQQEGQSRQVFVTNTPQQYPAKGTAVIPVPEGRMRLLEQQQYSSSLEANITRLPEPVHNPKLSPKLKKNEGTSPKISAVISESKNPFEEDYDEAKNPFAGDEKNDPTNPFAEDEDYDKNLNPFS